MEKYITTTEIIKMVTDDLLNDDRDMQIVYEKSKSARELVSKGKAVKNKIGSYLQQLDKVLENCEIEDIERVKQGWILLLYDLNGKKLPHVNMSISVIYFNEWVEDAVDYSTDHL